ncbi:hypothetical protein VNI00_018897 [Paramarasmius palmivorus]|uniref:Uncharacterized protein n=1 Tax=Paramarasmius palmivorus TaxID=297713 RepID=A0AAW0ASW3_9AGAR
MSTPSSTSMPALVNIEEEKQAKTSSSPGGESVQTKSMGVDNTSPIQLPRETIYVYDIGCHCSSECKDNAGATEIGEGTMSAGTD